MVVFGDAGLCLGYKSVIMAIYRGQGQVRFFLGLPRSGRRHSLLVFKFSGSPVYL